MLHFIHVRIAVVYLRDRRLRTAGDVVEEFLDHDLGNAERRHSRREGSAQIVERPAGHPTLYVEGRLRLSPTVEGGRRFALHLVPGRGEDVRVVLELRDAVEHFLGCLTDRKDVLPTVLRVGTRQRHRVLPDPRPLERGDLAAPLAGEHQQGDNAMEGRRTGNRRGKHGLQLVCGQHPLPRCPDERHPYVLHRGALDEVLADAPAEERAAGGEGMVALPRRRGEFPELLLDVPGRDVPHAPPSKGEVPFKQALVSIDRARPVLQSALGEVQLLRVVESAMEWPDLPERLFGEEALGLDPSVLERKGGIAANLLSPATFDENNESSRPTGGEPKAEALRRRVPVCDRAAFRRRKPLNGEVREI